LYEALPYKLNNSADVLKTCKFIDISNYKIGIDKKYCSDLQNDINLTAKVLEDAKTSLLFETSTQYESIKNLMNILSSDLYDGWMASGQFIFSYAFIKYTLTSLDSPNIKFMLEEIAEFTRLYNYLGRSDMCFRDNIGDFSNCLRNNRVCLNTNLDY